MKRVLVVDDEEMTRQMLAHFLSQFLDCDMAENGSVAYEMFTAAHQAGHPYDLTCIDIYMPVMGGLELLRKIRTYEDSHKMHYTKSFVISSSDSTENVIDSFFEGGCDDYIAKPFNSGALKLKLEKYGLV